MSTTAVQFQLAPVTVHYRTIVRKQMGGWPAALVPSKFDPGKLIWKVWASIRSMQRDLPDFNLVEDKHTPDCDEKRCNCPGIHPPAFGAIAPLYASMDDDNEF